ncbi:MAG: hypothetical protein NTZ83_04970 [Candidatus Pacearchaeota archaeon]|nr:hypothetical protein [Candidatus Pacearchaeota archaeon]
MTCDALKEKLNALGVNQDEVMIIKIKNAKIIGFDMPINNDCRRGRVLEASYNDISFEKI